MSTRLTGIVLGALLGAMPPICFLLGWIRGYKAAIRKLKEPYKAAIRKLKELNANPPEH